MEWRNIEVFLVTHLVLVCMQCSIPHVLVKFNLLFLKINVNMFTVLASTEMLLTVLVCQTDYIYLILQVLHSLHLLVK